MMETGIYRNYEEALDRIQELEKAINKAITYINRATAMLAVEVLRDALGR